MPHLNGEVGTGEAVDQLPVYPGAVRHNRIAVQGPVIFDGLLCAPEISGTGETVQGYGADRVRVDVFNARKPFPHPVELTETHSGLNDQLPGSGMYELMKTG